jgi:Holliday junction resolvase RusA-like endonuclease
MIGLEFTVYGRPVPQGSKRVFGGHVVESNKNLKPWRQDVVSAAQIAAEDAGITAPICLPVAVDVSFCFARPRSHYGTGRNADVIKASSPGQHHTQKPDGDKLLRALFDALTVAGVVRDDSYIAHCHWTKWWAESDYMAVEIWDVS